MGELWRYFNQDYWNHFQQKVVKDELVKHYDFYNQIKSDHLFEDDIYQALAALSKSMFKNEVENYNCWLKTKIPALDNHTPAELSSKPHGMNWIREYIIRQ
ncbi:MAG: DUF2384 domain-containing protein [Cyclobacteriaceae bacterium]|nr:DUF2384 domain-containing protein [Cyclobacteriaceae bacterium]